MTWVDLLVEYERWKTHNAGASPQTVSKYLGYLERLARWYRKPPEDPKVRPAAAGPLETTTDDLELFCGLYAHRIGMSPRSRKPMVAAMKSFYKWAHRRGRLPTNPAEHLVYPDAGTRLPEAASLESAEKLIMQPDLDTFLGVRDAAMIAMLIGCGPRASGLVGMNESDLIWGKEHGRQVCAALLNEKGRKQRVVPVPPEAQVLVRAYLGHPELQEIDRDLDAGERVLWVSTNCRTIPEQDYRGEKRRLSQRSLNDMLEKHGKAALVPKAHRKPHAWRHLYGTELAEHDVDLIVRQILMGHSDPKVTSIYNHLAIRKLREAAEHANPLRRINAPILEGARELHRKGSGS